MLTAYVVLSNRTDALEKAAAAVCGVGLFGVCANAARARSAKYLLRPDTISGFYRNIKTFEIKYSEIEYVSYTAENILLQSAGYIPLPYGILCFSTKPGFVITIDLKRPRRFRAGLLLFVPAKRVLFSVDDSHRFLSLVRERIELTRR